jgi:ABC-type branched-subunit amino acid transport system substrate-binding protein
MSVQNLLQLLNGSKKLRPGCIVASLFLLFLFAENGFASSRMLCLLPDTIPVSTDARTPKLRIDTVQWRDVTDQMLPISDEMNTLTDSIVHSGQEKAYRIQFLIPFGASALADPVSSRFVHFYAGVLLAIDLLKEEGVSLKVKVTDVGEKDAVWKNNISGVFKDKPDIVVGPLEKDDIKLMMDSCINRKATLISPWYSFTRLPEENPYYIQLKPNLRAHFSRMVEETTARYQKGEVVIVGRKNKDTEAWIQYFQERAVGIAGVQNFYNVYFANNDSISKGPTAFYRLFRNPDIKAIVLPNFSFSDEQWLYNVVRRLAAEKPIFPVTVYGMPVLYESEFIEADILSALNMCVITAEFVDDYDEGVKNFKRLYLETYGEIPAADAVRGYDLMVFIGRSLSRYGPLFQKAMENKAFHGLQSTYILRGPESDMSITAKSSDSPLFYDNTFLELIRFENNRWTR